MKKVCFATGNLYMPRKYDINETIDLIRKHLKVDGVELSLVFAEQLLELKLSKANARYLKSLRFNSIHAPLVYKDQDIRYSKRSKTTKKIFNKLHKIYDQVNAMNINFHSTNLKDLSLLKNSEYQYSIETLEKRHKKPITYYKSILDAFPNLKLVLDTSHALEVSPLFLRNLYKKYKKKIIYTHLSANIGKRIIHAPMSMVDNYIRKNLDIVKNLNHFVIETWIEDADTKLFKKEVSFVRKWIR